jgi:hypothetical protein
MKERGLGVGDSRRGEEEEGKVLGEKATPLYCLFHVARYHFEIKTLPGE